MDFRITKSSLLLRFFEKSQINITIDPMAFKQPEGALQNFDMLLSYETSKALS